MNNDITIILTSTVKVNINKIYLHQTDSFERVNIYIKSVKEWLYKTNFKVVLVENSGYTFEELNEEKELFKERFEVISYSESEMELSKWLIKNNSKGESELFSINYAIQNSKLIVPVVPVVPNTFIIKITARYFIPELEEYLNRFKLNDFDCLVQNNQDRCEMVGSNYKNIEYIFNQDVLTDLPLFCGHIESMYTYRTSKYKNLLICKEFQIEETKRGGANATFSTI
jgi:hypothetical protein